MSDARPIGVFDSGMGGLTVVRELFRLMPGERIIYLGDTARVPYGGRSDETISTFGRQDARFLEEMEIKLLVVACNTVSSVALESIEAMVKEIPVVGVVLPGARAAVLRTAERRIGVIGTAATIRAGAYARTVQTLDPAIKVYQKACPLFVPIVEEGIHNHDIARLAVQYYLAEMLDLDIDCIILGCTHYPLLLPMIQEMVSTRIHLLDSALWTAKEVQDILMALNGFYPGKDGGKEASRFIVTDLTPRFKDLAAAFLGSEIPAVEQLALDDLAKPCVTSART
ncbi:MAG: glutamate racemase [Chitinispirillaceae bacterium]|nr:glutamate racemase [Chitinispirillaceae bacterium]